ncbi:Ubiquinone biosynthesis protein coq9, mitochondrial [Boothiomyces sp. JEL0866]|nr:Ubiquinone biosynthesis protein coq9, mitochondrial [Boothiomyces sp. JEL0866]
MQRRAFPRLFRHFSTLDPKYQIKLQANQEKDLRTELLDASLFYVPSDGFTKTALVKGAESLGWNPITNGLCSRGPIELVEHFIEKSTLELHTTVTEDFEKLGTTGKIRQLVLNRLNMTEPYLEHWPTAVNMMLQPQNALSTARQLKDLTSEMWHLAGDTSVDLNWYSKRLMLAGVYTSTEMYMTSDQSEGYENTKHFLDERLKDIGKVGKTISDISKFTSFGYSQVVGIINSKRL